MEDITLQEAADSTIGQLEHSRLVPEVALDDLIKTMEKASDKSGAGLVSSFLVGAIAVLLPLGFHDMPGLMQLLISVPLAAGSAVAVLRFSAALEAIRVVRMGLEEQRLHAMRSADWCSVETGIVKARLRERSAAAGE